MNKEFQNWFDKYLDIQQFSLPATPLEEKIAEAAWKAAQQEINKEEYDYLLWFFVNADFGPADGDVRFGLEEWYKEETKKKVPKTLKHE